jgi:diadenosine tetraphosphate (Ap4A) HIT family hydrolase
MLRKAVDYQKINYLMLMMVDPDVHFHVIPRYEGNREMDGVTVSDVGWPGPPRLDQAVSPNQDQTRRLVDAFKRIWSES